MSQIEKKISSELKFSGKIVNVRVDQVQINSHQVIREVVEHPGGVCILACTTDNHVLIVEQFRYGCGDFLVELPAGKKEKDENPLLTAQRELAEETGYTAEKWLDLGVFYPSPAYLQEVIHLYVATQLTYIGQKLDDGEYLKVSFMPFNELVSKVVQGEIKDGKTAVLTLRYDYLLRLDSNEL